MKRILHSQQKQNNAQLGAPGREGASKRASVCESADDCIHENESKGHSLLSRIMQSELEDRKQQVILQKRHKIKFRKNRLWNKKQRNGKVIWIAPEDYQKLG